MDSVIFRTATYGCLTVGLVVVYPFLVSITKSSNTATSSKPPLNIASSCWSPEQLSLRDTDFLNQLCNVHFRASLNNKDSAGDTRIIFSDDQRAAFDKSREFVHSEEPNAFAEVFIDVLPFLVSQFILAILSRTVSNCIRSASRTNAWVLQSAWERFVWSSASGESGTFQNGGQLTNGADHRGETDMMLTPLRHAGTGQSEDALTGRLKELLASRVLGIAYFTLHILSAIAWLTLSIVCFVFLGSIRKEAPLGFVSPDGTQYIGGDYFCDAKVRTHHNTQRYFIQCVYTASRELPQFSHPPSSGEFHSLVFGLTMAFCVILFALEVIFILFSFWISQPLRRRNVNLILSPSILPSNETGLSFVFCDLALAASFWKPDIGDINVCFCRDKKKL